MSKAYTLATLATSDLATQTDLTTAIDGIVIPDGGKIVQTKHYNFTSQITMNSAGGDGSVHAGCNITPTSASNKVLVIVSTLIEGAGGINDYANVDLYRDSAYIHKFVNALGYGLNAGVRNAYTINYLDDPQTTSQVEYSLDHFNAAGSTDYYYQVANYTLLEIAA